MTLYEQIVAVHPELIDTPEVFIDGTIILQDDSDGAGPYIKQWNHPTLPQLDLP